MFAVPLLPVVFYRFYSIPLHLNSWYYVMDHARHRRREGGVYLIIMCQCDYSFYFYLCISLILYHYIVSSRYSITVIPVYYIPFYSMINAFIFLQCHSTSFPFSFIPLYFNPYFPPHLLYYLLFNEVLYDTLLIKIVLLYFNSIQISPWSQT